MAELKYTSFHLRKIKNYLITIIYCKWLVQTSKQAYTHVCARHSCHWVACSGLC